MSVTTRCKFRCESVQKIDGAEPAENITLRASYDDSPENKVWSKYTPSGSFQMYVTNPAVLGRFVQGKDYYLDISEV